jgi:cytoskeletal protein CcmA (bactofilin family)
MGLFGNKYDSVKEFSDMRVALGRGEAAKEPEAVSQAGGAVGQDRHETAPEGTVGAVGDTDADTPQSPPEPATLARVKAGPTAPEECSSVVSAGSTWQGTLNLDGSVRIDGQLTGDIDARDTVHISEGAQVDAKVKAAFVVIAGAFQGQVECSERLELLPTSRTQGELSTKSLMIHEGAFINGQIHMSGDQGSAGSGRGAQPRRSSSGSPKLADPVASDAAVSS